MDDIPRLLTIKSPLADDVLIATSLVVTESLGLPYAIEVGVLGSDAAMLPSALLTKSITVTVSQRVAGSVVKRHFNGLVAEFQRLGPGPSGREAFRLVAVPGIWRLGLKQNCRIFQDKTARQIVDAIVKEHGLPAPTWGIVPTLASMPYCTQFNETDLAFVSRLLEEHGLTYYHAHTETAHVLYISGTAAGFPTFVGGDAVGLHERHDFFHLSNWHSRNLVRSSATEFEDMDAERMEPSVVVSKTKATIAHTGEPTMPAAGKVFRWPGGTSTRPGVDPAAIVMGELETASEEYGAVALDPRYSPGVKLGIAIKKEDGTSASQQYVVTDVRHEATDDSGLRSGSGGTETYSASLSLVAAARTWMPKARHPRPVMAGLYSAKVTGPAGEQIHVDEFGRIKVKFRWDRLSPSTDASSCWLRVMQAAGGAWGGTWFLPRVGDEVLVAFMDSDPDRPLVTGAVYGKGARPPFLPGTNRAQQGIRTRSYKSNSSEDANILRFEDKKGSEEILVHAQKDLNIEVEHDETRKVEHDRTTTVGHDQTTTVQNARTATIKDSHDTLTVEKGNRSATIKMGNDTVTVEMGNETHTIKMGNLTMKCELGAITLEAMQSITLKVGQSTVVVDQMGITTKGMLIKDEAQVMHQTKAVMIKEEASAMVQVQGGIVMVN